MEDITNVPRVINAMKSLTDEDWKKKLVWFKNEYQKLMEDPMSYSHWSIPDDQWQMSMTDFELPKTLINQQWFHESMNPRMRHTLLSNTIMCVTLLQRFITDADDAGVLHPKTR